MGREELFKYIEEKLLILSTKVKISGRLNMLDTNSFCEVFYCRLFNLVFGYDFENTNQNTSNYEAIDLIDHKNKIVAQVSSRKDKKKIEDSLSKEIIKTYNNYHYIYLCIIEAPHIASKDYSNPYGIIFDPEHDCFDVGSILKQIKDLGIDTLSILCDFVKKELVIKDENKLFSDLAEVVNIINKGSKSRLKSVVNNTFDVDRKIDFNKLESYKDFFHEYVVYYSKLNEIYKSYSESDEDAEEHILSSIRSIYLKNKNIFEGVGLLETIISTLQKDVVDSRNFNPELISKENLEFCIQIIVTDAFIKCKIFENPEGYKYANAE